jgi:hypothetical protein
MNQVKNLGTIDVMEIYEGEPVDYPMQKFLHVSDYNRLAHAWKEINPATINYYEPMEPKIISRGIDTHYNIHYIEDSLSQLIERPNNTVNHKIKNYLSNSLGELWNMDAVPFSRIVASYLTSPVWTHYLDWAYNWTEKGKDFEVLNLILEYAFERNEVELLKLPSHNALQQNGWKVVPIIRANEMEIDPANFTKEEPLLSCITPYVELRLAPRMIKRFGSGKISIRNVPKIFYSSVLIMSKMMFPGPTRYFMGGKGWESSSLDAICTSGGAMWSKTMEYVKCEYEPELDDFAYCQLCERETVVCSHCDFRDLLFCHVHSGMIKESNNKRDYCRQCKYLL